MVTRPLALAADGRPDEALVAIERSAQTGSQRRIRRLVATAVALDAPQLARSLLDRLSGDGSANLRLDALIATRASDLTQAKQVAHRAGWRAVRLHSGLEGEIRALRVADEVVGAAPPTAAGDTSHPERVLHLVTNALPETTAGCAVRTHGIVLAQRRLGMDPHIVTRLGFPVTAGSLRAGRLVIIDGVPYHRLLPFGWLPVRDDRALALDIRETRRLVDRLRPAILHAHSKHTNARVALSVGRQRRLPVLYEVRGLLEETWRSRDHPPDKDSYQLARQAETACMRLADMVVTLAETMRAEIISRGIQEDQVVVVPNVVDDRFLRPPPDPGRASAPTRHSGRRGRCRRRIDVERVRGDRRADRRGRLAPGRRPAHATVGLRRRSGGVRTQSTR